MHKGEWKDLVQNIGLFSSAMIGNFKIFTLKYFLKSLQ